MVACVEIKVDGECVCCAALWRHRGDKVAINNHLKDRWREIIIALGMVKAERKDAICTIGDGDGLLHAGILIGRKLKHTIANSGEVRVRVRPFLNFDLSEDRRPAFNRVKEPKAVSVGIEIDRIVLEIAIDDQINAYSKSACGQRIALGWSIQLDIFEGYYAAIGDSYGSVFSPKLKFHLSPTFTLRLLSAFLMNAIYGLFCTFSSIHKVIRAKGERSDMRASLQRPSLHRAWRYAL